MSRGGAGAARASATHRTRATFAAAALAFFGMTIMAGRAFAQTAPSPGAPAPAASPPEERFDILAIDVDGATALTDEELEQAVYPYLGPDRRAADVEAARAAVEAIYRDRGFQTAVVEIPRQSTTDGVIKLSVLEATVGRLRVTGSKFHSLEAVRKGVPALAEDTLPDLKAAQTQIDTLNRQPSRQVTPLLKPGRVPGTIDVDLKVADTAPWHASVEITDDHSPNTTPLRLTATASYDNLWQAGHTISATYAVAPQNKADSEVYAGSYLAPVGGTGWSILAYGYSSNSNVATVGSTDVLGQGYAIGLRGITQLPKWGPFSPSFSFGIDYKHFLDRLTFGTDEAQSTCVRNPANCGSVVNYWPLTGVFGLATQDAASSARINVTITAGLHGAGSGDAAFGNARAYARTDFFKVALDGEYTRRLPFALTANARFAAQVADTPLVSSEQFSAGGLSSVRGYLQAETVGDEGVDLQLELRRPVGTPGLLGRYLTGLTPYLFLDGAEVSLIQALPGQTSESVVYSSGLGARFQLFDKVNGQLLLGVPLQSSRASPRGRALTVFNLKTEF